MIVSSLYSSYSSAPPASGREFSRLLTAAVVNRKFRQLLLTNPGIALESGYNGESFRLGTEEKDLVLSIRAKSLPDFAMQLAGRMEKDNPLYLLSRNGQGLDQASL